MHQAIDTLQVPDLPFDLDKLISSMSGAKPFISLPNSRGIGKKCCIQAEIEDKQVIIEFFSELLLEEEPSDPTLGYRNSDIKKTRGVMLATYEATPNKDGYHPNYGEIMDYDDFVNKYVHTNQMKIRLDRIMDAMDNSVEVNETFLDSANVYWESKDLDAPFKLTVLH